MAPSKNETVTIRITDISQNGEGIGKTEGYTLFVKDAVPGDLAEVLVTKVGKTYGYGRLMHVAEASPHRAACRCPIAKACGGCQIQQIDYEYQLKLKEKKVINDLERIGGFTVLQISEAEDGTRTYKEAEESMDTAIPVLPVIGMEHPWRYRNKAQYPVGTDKMGNPIAGFYAGRTHSIIPCTDCLLGTEENRDILEKILDWMKKHHIRAYDETSGEGLIRHVLVRKGFATGEIIVCLIINGNRLPAQEALIQELTAIPGMKGITISKNTEKTNVIMKGPVRTIWGQDYIEDTIDGVRFRISPASFYQVNPMQTEKLYRTALEYAGLTGTEDVIDLYCGIGTISLFLARHAKHVTGVEIVPQAIEDARKNAALNGLTNVDFHVGKAEEVVPRLYREEGLHADVVVVDPPRKGCDEKLLQTMIQMTPDRIVYVSCDPATMSRDLKMLAASGYQIKKVQPVDQFCHTVHVESCVLLERVSNRKVDSYVKLNVKMADYYRIKDSAETENVEE